MWTEKCQSFYHNCNEMGMKFRSSVKSPFNTWQQSHAGLIRPERTAILLFFLSPLLLGDSTIQECCQRWRGLSVKAFSSQEELTVVQLIKTFHVKCQGRFLLLTLVRVLRDGFHCISDIKRVSHMKKPWESTTRPRCDQSALRLIIPRLFFTQKLWHGGCNASFCCLTARKLRPGFHHPLRVSFTLFPVLGF